ncbi:tyrosine-type recombinase/integrase [Terrilactibacillus sp. S3-3]|nr:tyrosine-type recombinase/integrase [Terrilactibacillus sp. S3-3]
MNGMENRVTLYFHLTTALANLSERRVSGRWRRFLKRKGLKHINFHALRHTSVSLLIDEKVPMKDISERAGHVSGIAITMDTYGHLLEDSDKRAAQSLDKAIKSIQAMK